MTSISMLCNFCTLNDFKALSTMHQKQLPALPLWLYELVEDTVSSSLTLQDRNQRQREDWSKPLENIESMGGISAVSAIPHLMKNSDKILHSPESVFFR